MFVFLSQERRDSDNQQTRVSSHAQCIVSTIDSSSNVGCWCAQATCSSCSSMLTSIRIAFHFYCSIVLSEIKKVCGRDSEICAKLGQFELNILKMLQHFSVVQSSAKSAIPIEKNSGVLIIIQLKKSRIEDAMKRLWKRKLAQVVVHISLMHTRAKLALRLKF